MRAGLAYHELHKGGETSWWRVLVGVLVLLLNFLGLMLFPLLLLAGFVGSYVAQGDTYREALDRLTGDTVTPAFLAYLNLTLATAIPTVMILTYVLHGWLKPGWIAS